MKKKSGKKHWFNTKPIQVALEGNPEVSSGWLDILTANFEMRFAIQSRSTGNWSSHIKSSTVKKALKNGHLDIEIYGFVNPLRRIAVSRQTPNGPRTIASWVAYGPPRNWVLDMDNVSGITGEIPKDRIHSLIAKLERFNCPLPVFICETSPFCYHLVYTGTNDCEWNTDARYALALRAAGCEVKVRTKQERDDALRSGGVDPKYLSQNIESAKFRIPGSINITKSCGRIDTSSITDRIEICGWQNPNYKIPTKDQIVELGSTTQPKRQNNLSKISRPLPDGAWKRFMPTIQASLEPLIREDLLVKLSEFLSKNYNMLRQGRCRILQVYMADCLGVEQYLISRILRRLNKLGYLVMTADYHQCKRARTYGAGPQLRTLFEEVTKAKSRHDINKPYVDGDVNDHYLADIRHLIRIGTPMDEVVQIIMKKQQGRSRDKVRSAKQIEQAYLSWFNKIQHQESIAG